MKIDWIKEWLFNRNGKLAFMRDFIAHCMKMYDKGNLKALEIMTQKKLLYKFNRD